MGTDGFEAADGQVTRVSGSIRAPTRPGVYFLRVGAERIGALVVNPEPQESDLRRLDPSLIKDRIRGASIVATADPAAFRASLFSSGSKRPLQVPLLLVALALLAAEVWVVRRTEREAAG